MAAWLPVTASVLALTGIATGLTAFGNGDCSSCTLPASTPAAITTSVEATDVEDSPALAEQEVYVIKFHADWCPKCKSLTPVYDAVAKSFSDKPVSFVKLDVTDKAKTKESGETMKELGLGDVWAKNEGKNGFIMLVDAETKESVKVLKVGTTEKQATEAINQALED